MKTAIQSTENRLHFLRDLAGHQPGDLPEWLREIRKQGKTVFDHMPFPETSMEEWRQTPLKPLLKKNWRSRTGSEYLMEIPPDPWRAQSEEWAEAVFVDGYFAPALSRVHGLPEGVFAGSLQQALQQGHENAVRNHLNRYLGTRNAFTALNTAFLEDGACLLVPRNTVVERPVHFLFITSAGTFPHAVHIRNLIVLEPGSQATVLTTWLSPDTETVHFNNVVEEIRIRDNARLHRCQTTALNSAAFQLAAAEIHLDRDSHLTSMNMDAGGRITRNENAIRLAGENSECFLNGLYLNDGKRLVDNNNHIAHMKPHCTSRVFSRGILDDHSHAVFRCMVHVFREAQQTDSNQLNNNLLLSDRATIHTRPQLEIYADDVSCTHGATIGAPPEEVIFYFRSRGISENTARAMLTQGFAGEVLRSLDVPELRRRLENGLVEKYRPAG